MKKLTAFLLTMLLLCSCALAELISVGDTALMLDLGGLECYELTDEDAENDIVLWFGDGGEHLDAAIFSSSSFGASLEDLLQLVDETADESLISRSMMSINGIDVLCTEEKDLETGDRYILYYAIDQDQIVQFTFWYDTEAAAAAVNDVMSTLVKRPTLTGSSMLSALGGMFGNLLDLPEAETDSDPYAWDRTPAEGVTAIEHTGLTIDLTDLYLWELTEEDIADDIVLCFADEYVMLDAIVWVYDAEGSTLADMEAWLAEEHADCDSTSGYATINGIELLYWMEPSDAGDIELTCVALDSGNFVFCSIYCCDDEALQLAQQVMSTLTY